MVVTSLQVTHYHNFLYQPGDCGTVLEVIKTIIPIQVELKTPFCSSTTFSVAVQSYQANPTSDPGNHNFLQKIGFLSLKHFKHTQDTEEEV